VNPTGFRFCGTCGAPLAEEVPAPAARVAGERRRVTVLFADLVGFSTLAEHLDPEELQALITGTFSELTEAVERREGFVEKFIGDAVVAVFGAPVTHEDDPLRAVESALEMLEIVRRRSSGAPAPLELRVGINSGLVISGGVGDGTQAGVMGDAVNVAARLQQAAAPGETLLSASTWRRVREGFAAESVGELEVKGKAQAVETYRLLERREQDLRYRAPFVGRREELALLDLLWSSVRKGNTHVASLAGEPGVGKSRLLAEFRPEGAQLDVRLACSGERAFGPFLELVAALLGGLPASVEEVKEKTSALALGDDDTVLLGAFLGLGGAPPVVRMADEQRKRQVFAGVWQFLLAACRWPTFIAFDDVHWADASSRELLDFLLERLGGLPLMLVLCYRPGFEQVERAELRASHTAVRLEPLSADESVALARGYLGVDTLPADLERLVAERAEGNAFFIEELLQALLELGSLAVVEERAVLAKVDVEIPDTVQGTILARVDRLEPSARSLLQHAAVLGRSFPAELLEAVAGNGNLSSALASLERAQLLVAPAPREWAFKHALIQEVAYETLLLRQRRDLHRKVAEALEQRAGDDPGLLEALAEHYARAEAPEQARRYAVAAGDRAQERMGFVEAKRRYETALRLWGTGDEEGRLELLLKLGRAAFLAGDNSASRAALIEAAEAWRERGETRRAGGALAVLGRVYWNSGEADRAAATLQEAITLLEKEPSPELVDAYSRAATVAMVGGRIVRGTELAERGLELADELGLGALRSHLLNTLGCCRVFAGDAEGLTLIREALELAQKSGDAEAIGRGYVNLSDTCCKVGRLREAVAVAEEGRAVMRRLGAATFDTFIAGNQAQALVHLGRLGEVESLTRELIGEHREVLGGAGFVNAAGTLFEVLVRRGAYEEARAQADEVLPAARGLGGAEFLGPVLRSEASLEAARGNHAAARQAIREAIEMALDEAASYHVVATLPTAVRLLGPDECRRLLDFVEDTPSYSFADAHKAEANAVVEQDPARSREAAELYRDLEMPYEEARCRVDAGELERARELARQFGFEHGPLAPLLS
jgi:class 3 adenylate cyclase/tetratricopeptide (TPR) repeat protein